MTPPDETLSWTDAQIEFEIARNTPEDSAFVCEWREGAWSARIERVVDGQSKLVHSVLQLDRRMALYDVYGFLWMRGQPGPSKGSLWDPTTQRPTVAAVSRYVQSNWADPEDLDPAEVASVYGIRPQRKGPEN